MWDATNYYFHYWFLQKYIVLINWEVISCSVAKVENVDQFPKSQGGILKYVVLFLMTVHNAYDWICLLSQKPENIHISEAEVYIYLLPMVFI